MSILVSLHHATRYQYDRLVALRPQIVRLRPGAAQSDQGADLFSWTITPPKKHFINWQQDPFGNYLARLVFPDRTSRIQGRGRSGGR